MFFLIKVSLQLSDDYKSIEGKKRMKQNELLLQVAVFYLCLQLLLKSVGYFIVFSIRKGRTNDEMSAPCNEISLIRFNQVPES